MLYLCTLVNSGLNDMQDAPGAIRTAAALPSYKKRPANALMLLQIVSAVTGDVIGVF